MIRNILILSLIVQVAEERCIVKHKRHLIWKYDLKKKMIFLKINYTQLIHSTKSKNLIIFISGD